MKQRILLVLALCAVLTGPVSAAAGTATTATGGGATAAVDGGVALQTNNSTGNDTDGNATDGQIDFGAGVDDGNDTSGGGGGDGSGGDSSFFGIDLGTVAQDAVEGAVISLLNGFAEDAGEVVAQFQEEGIVFGIPAPGEPASPVSWLNPTGDTTEGQRWVTTQTYHWVFGFLGFAGLLPALMLAMGKGNRKPDRGTAKRFVRGFVMILVGWIIIAFCYHLADTVVRMIAPSYDQYQPVLRNAEVDKRVLGAVLGGAKGLFLTTALGVLYVQYILAFVCAAVWPAMWVLMAYRSTMARSAGKIALAFMGSLVVIKLLQATIFRFLVQFQFGTPVANEVAATVGITVAFLLLPYTVLTKMIPRTLLIFGLHELREKGREDKRYQERLGNVRRKFNQSLRRSPDGGVERVGPANRGSNGLPNRRAGKLESGRADGERGLPRGSDGRPDRRADGGDTEDRR